MNDIEMNVRDFYLYIILGGALLGAVFGIVPLILGRRRNKKRLGFYGFLASIAGGALAPLVAIVVAAVFSWVIIKGGTAEDTDGHPPADNETTSV
jgi:hypothetical protein